MSISRVSSSSHVAQGCHHSLSQLLLSEILTCARNAHRKTCSRAQIATSTTVAYVRGDVLLTAIGIVAITIIPAHVAYKSTSATGALSNSILCGAHIATSTTVIYVRGDVMLTAIGIVAITIIPARVAYKSTSATDALSNSILCLGAHIATSTTVVYVRGDVMLTAIGNVAVTVSPIHITGGVDASGVRALPSDVGKLAHVSACTTVVEVARYIVLTSI